MIAFLALMTTAMASDPFHGAAWLTIPKSQHAIDNAKWIWAKTSDLVPTIENAPVGLAVLVRSIDVSDAMNAKMWFACDNRCEVYLGNVLVGESDDWSSLTEIDLNLREGINRIRVVAKNDAGTALNPAGFIAAIKVGDNVIVSDSKWDAENGRVVELGPASTAPWRMNPPDQGHCPIFRHEFTAPSNFQSARLRVVGLGHFQARINGIKVGEAALNQSWSQYDKRIYYEEFDVAPLLKSGNNAIGFLLGNGFWSVQSPPSGRAVKGDAMPDFAKGAQYVLRFSLEIIAKEGSTTVVTSDQETKWNRGPVTLSHIYAGEDFDKRKEPHGWDRPGFAAASWNKGQITKLAAHLQKRFWPDLAEKNVFRPVEILQPSKGVWSYVFPQNVSALLRFTVRGKTGQTIRFKPSEVMTEQGEVQQLNLWGKRATFDYTMATEESETHQWLFHYNGYQYVEVTGAVPQGKPNPDGLPVIEKLESVHVATDNREIGRFSSSSNLYNDTHRIVDWAMKSNMSWVMTDCPHREKLGWLECAHLLMPTFAYRYNCRDWFKKICADMRDSQLDTGRVLTVAPKYLMRPPDDIYAFTLEWGAASVLLPWQAYRWYGEVSFLTDNYVMMKRFVDHIADISPDYIAPGRLGDWYDYGHGQSPGPSRFTPTDLSSTASWAMCIDALIEASEVLGRTAAATTYRELHSKVRSAFLAKFYNTQTKSFANTGSPQTAHAMALCANLVPDVDRESVLQGIIDDLERRGYQQTSGDVGHLYFIRALADAGRSDLLHKVYSRTGTGSYGGILSKGLTTMPETWDAITVGSNSLNHCMLGHVMEWFYGWVLGVRQAADSIGWSNILIAPEPGELASSSGYITTPKGRVNVNWSAAGGRFELEVSIPTGSTALVVMPFGKEVTLNGQTVRAKTEPLGKASVTLPSGTHKVISE